ncbi:hypothetical protein TcCL_NonESM07945 [Trypanosoma cruzi]|nr:hypothetical protein TcCL_NonESM07945 [Trypanosoma cruzi]
MHDGDVNTRPHQPHHWMLGACQHPRFPNVLSRGRDGGSTPEILRAILGDHISLTRCLCLPAPSPSKMAPVQRIRYCILLHWTLTLGSRVYGMTSSPESSSTSDAHTVIVCTKWTLRFKWPSTVWCRADAHWRWIGNPAISSWIFAGPCRRPSGC